MSRLQKLILIFSFIWGLYEVAMWRTQSFGLTWRDLAVDLLVILVCVMPIAALAVIGLPWRKAGAKLLALCVSVIALVEIYAGAQEYLVIRHYGENPDKLLFVKRWPPFGHHFIGYSPGYGWMGGD